MSTPEGRVKAKVKRALDVFGGYRFMPVQNGMGAPGLDFFCCIYGMFVAIETKVEGKKLTPRQRETAVNIARSGGLVFVVRNDDDVQKMLIRLEVWRTHPPGNGVVGAGVIYDTLSKED